MKDYSYIVMLLDRSGSMSTMKQSMESAIDNFIKEQKACSGEASFTLVQFDDRVDKKFDRIPINSVPYITIVPRGATALYDALGQTIDNVGQELASMDEDQRPNKVIFVAITDGFENASRTYERLQVLDKINHQSSVYNWKFIYLGANQDAIMNGASVGFNANSCSNYTMDNAWTILRNASKAISAYRLGQSQDISL